MPKKLTEQDINQFLECHPEFVEKWLSNHGMEEIAIDLSKYRVVSKHAIKVLDMLSFREEPTVSVDKKRAESVVVINQMDLYRDILKSVCSDGNFTRSTENILESACILLRCQKTCLFLAKGFGKNRYLTLDTRSETDEIDNTEENMIYLPFGQGIDGFVAENKCLVNIKEARRDPRFKDDIDEESDFQTKSILSVPILDKNGHVIGVVKAVNKLGRDYFDCNDESLLNCFSKICAVSLNSSHFFKTVGKENKRHQMLLTLNRCLLNNRNDLQNLVSEIIQHAMKTLNCDNISVYIIDNTNDSHEATESMKVLQFLREDTEVKHAPIDPRFIPFIEQNMNSASMVNVVNLGKSPNKTIIRLEGDIRNWIICVTITSDGQNVIGYMMFLRKTIETFSETDINMLETFAIFCGLAIYNNYLYRSCDKIMSIHDTTRKMLQFHLTCEEKEAYKMQFLDIQTTSYYKLYSYSYISYIYTEDEQISLSVLMFLEMNVLNLLRISKFTLYKWILTVKRNYRPVTYHNWQHAINVTQTMFCMLTTGKLQVYFKELEQICLLIACLFHDVDHRGTNNAFQVNTASPLATLYSTSIMEYHHINRSMMLLENDETNIFRNLPAEKYQQALKIIEKAILSTDIVVYFEKRNLFKQQIENGNKTFESPESIDLLIGMMMTAADLSCVAKPWDFQKTTAMLIADEFFTQGDMERAANIPVLPLMDRNKMYEIPQMQVGFIDFVCSMVYKAFSELHTELQPLYDEMLINRAHWAGIADGDEEFDVNKEYEKALKMFHSKDPMPSTISPELYRNVATQTVLTYFNLEQEQQTIQTILSFPIAELVSSNDLMMPVSPETEMISTVTKDCQTESRSLNLSEASVQTYVPATRTGEELPAEPLSPIFRRPGSATTRSGDYSGSETVISTFSKSSGRRSPHILRRSSCFDELVYERRRELDMGIRRSLSSKFHLEKPLSIKRSSHIILPPNPVRQESSPATRSNEYLFKKSSSTIRFSSGELSENDEILFEENFNGDSLKEEVLEPVNNENVSENIESGDTNNKKELQLPLSKKQKLSWTAAYESKSFRKIKMPVALKTPSIMKERKETENKPKQSSGIPKRLSQGIELRKRKCVKVVPKTVQKSKKMAIWERGKCVIS